MAKRRPSDGQRSVNLALQGGGAHGAFTWGVLDRLLEDGRVAVEAISGSSAGAINAAVLAQGHQGWRRGCPRRARPLLAPSPTRSAAEPVHRGPTSGRWQLEHRSFAGLDLRRSAMPVVLALPAQPVNFLPLRDLLAGMLDIEALTAPRSIKLFVTATNVRTGKARIFERRELTLDALLASACLPQIFQAVVIEAIPIGMAAISATPRSGR